MNRELIILEVNRPGGVEAEARAGTARQVRAPVDLKTPPQMVAQAARMEASPDKGCQFGWWNCGRPHGCCIREPDGAARLAATGAAVSNPTPHMRLLRHMLGVYMTPI